MLDLQSAPQNLFHIINMYSIGGHKPGVRFTVTLATRGVVWIRKNSTDLLEYMQSMSLSSCNCIKHDFYTLCTTITHSKLKDSLRELVQLCFKKKTMANVDTNTLR